MTEEDDLDGKQAMRRQITQTAQLAGQSYHYHSIHTRMHMICGLTHSLLIGNNSGCVCGWRRRLWVLSRSVESALAQREMRNGGGGFSTALYWILYDCTKGTNFISD